MVTFDFIRISPSPANGKGARITDVSKADARFRAGTAVIFLNSEHAKSSIDGIFKNVNRNEKE